MWMINLNEIRSTDAVKDDAERWAIWQEFNLRHEAYERHKRFVEEGVVGVMKRFRLALVGTKNDEVTTSGVEYVE